MLVSKGFSIIAIGNEKFFNDGNIPKVKEITNKMLLRAEAQGQPIKDGKQISVGDKTYNLV